MIKIFVLVFIHFHLWNFFIGTLGIPGRDGIPGQKGDHGHKGEPGRDGNNE